MKCRWSLVLCAALYLTIAAAGYYMANPEAALAVGLGNVLDVQAGGAALDQQEDVSGIVNALSASAGAKRALAREVIAGRLSLQEAAARCRAVSVANPYFNESAFRVIYAGDSEEERWCRCVICFVGGELRGKPERAAVTARLEAELRESLASRESPAGGRGSCPLPATTDSSPPPGLSSP